MDQTDKAIALLDALHAEVEDLHGNGEPFFDDLFDRIGVIIAVLRDGYDPGEGVVA